MTNNFGDVNVTTGAGSNVGMGSHISQSVTVNDPDALHRLGVAAQELADLLNGGADVEELRAAGQEVERTAKDPTKSTEAVAAGQRVVSALGALNLLVAGSSALNIINILTDFANAALG
ncbi:hypothetical protein [Actinomycetospora lemnae]|uniref:Uncharacterized protein n=1 Tax=Actinomycetospora lemnae TaxID=3019891 RepID=A0ABT5SYH3_9PSEU|nr:hypothetical protein [Actinomycetospora sp. DW7H6]MDD7967804.1 hypothetical protein [Actinomycetospora sp. DW7H6]